MKVSTRINEVLHRFDDTGAYQGTAVYRLRITDHEDGSEVDKTLLPPVPIEQLTGDDLAAYQDLHGGPATALVEANQALQAQIAAVQAEAAAEIDAVRADTVRQLDEQRAQFEALAAEKVAADVEVAP